MKVIIKGGFTYTAEYLIKEEAYAKLIAVAETCGYDNVSSMLDLYLKSNVHNLNGVDKYAMMMLKNSIISFETHFPSNFVTITAHARECEAEVGPCHERYEEVKKMLDIAFTWRVDILNFIRGKLDASDIIDKE